MEDLSRRALLIGMSTMALASATPVLGAGAGQLLLAGGYTGTGSKSRGIYAYRWNAARGEMSALGLAAQSANPSFLALAPDRRVVYAVNEIDTYQGKRDGSVSAFTIDAAAGRLTLLNTVSSGGAGPCHVSVHPSGNTVLVANYDAGSAASFRVLAGGRLSAAVSNPHYTGKGPNADRQTGPHAHCVTPTPDRQHVLINDLGLDQIHVYQLDAASAGLTANGTPAYQSAPGSGPRSLVFHPAGRYAYTTDELSNTINVLSWEPAGGTLKSVQVLPTADQPGDTRNTAASVVIDRAGENLYVSNRGPENSIAHYAIAHNGQLAFIARTSTGGKTPRHFALDPGEQWIVVAHQGSNDLAVLGRNTKDGSLSPTGRNYAIDMPTAVLFV